MLPAVKHITPAHALRNTVLVQSLSCQPPRKSPRVFFPYPDGFFSCSSVVLLDACILGISSLIDLVMGRSEQRGAMERSSRTHTVYTFLVQTHTHIHNLPPPRRVSLVLFICIFAPKMHKSFGHSFSLRGRIEIWSLDKHALRMFTSHYLLALHTCSLFL